jgi:hypothetical protein
LANVERIRHALALVRAGDGFAAHEVLEDLWRDAPDAERDLYQGLVHAAVATYQERRGTAYEPAYEGIDIAALRAWCAASLAAERCPPLPADVA